MPLVSVNVVVPTDSLEVSWCGLLHQGVVEEEGELVNRRHFELDQPLD